MSVTLAIAINSALSAALLGVLGWAMHRVRRLDPHEPAQPHLEVVRLRDGARVVADTQQRLAA